MAINSVPAGAVPAHSLHGVPVFDQRQAQVDGARIAPPSAPYLGRGNFCSANDDTCEGRKAKGTDYCYGHLKQFGLVPPKNKVKVVDDADVTVDVATDS